MAKNEKVSKTYRLHRKTVALLEQYSHDEGITQTEAVERAIKSLCRASHAPATQQDLAAVAELMKAGFSATQEAILKQPIAAIEAPKKETIWQKLFGK